MEATRPVVDLPVEGSLPPLSGATGWLNSPPVTAADLGGHAVLVNFWTYTCINWLRQLPYLRAWSEKYQDQGLIVLGVHTPEFDVEHDLDNLRRAATDLRVDYALAVVGELTQDEPLTRIPGGGDGPDPGASAARRRASPARAAAAG
jgi:thiol-disulfide isomerase/thioredoxin